MASSVFFRFKSQKEPTRVAFDGTGISVFELKREVISMNRLGDGTDFELIISSEDTGEEYDDDTFSIPRSTTVIAKRLPALKPGRGGASRYVSGKMPQNAKNSHRAEPSTSNFSSIHKATDAPRGLSDMAQAQTEEERIAAMYKLGADQWAQQQREMANATPIHRAGPPKGKQANFPDRPPPQGYVCYRCGEKGHWIQACPTNDDPSFVNRPRVKRTTGIPRSFLKTVEKPSQTVNDGTIDDTKQPPGVMVDADGEWVIAEPDQASWDQFQAKTKISAAAQEAAARGSKELQDLGLECPIDRRLFIEPTKTPCCQRVYCLECITNSLLENNLRCPHCDTENILLDDLKVDIEMNRRVHEYEKKQLAVKEPKSTDVGAEGEKSHAKGMNDFAKKGDQAGQQQMTEQAAGKSPAKDAKPTSLSAVVPRPSMPSSAPSKEQSVPKKRAAESELPNIRARVDPGFEKAQEVSRGSSSGSINPSLSSTTGNATVAHGMPPMAFPNSNGFMNMSMNMAPSLMYNPMMMTNSLMGGNGNNWNTAWGQNYTLQTTGTPGLGFSNGSLVGGNFGNAAMPVPLPMPTANGFGGFGGMPSDGQGSFPFLNQQRNQFGRSNGNDEESAYFRKPINPQRHQARRNMSRPTDYHEL